MVALVVGFLISLGYLSFIPAYLILVLGDIIPDSIYYYLGRFGNERALVKKYFSGEGFLAGHLQAVEKLWHHHGGKTMFFSKLAYGLSTPFLISAGLAKLPVKKFFTYALPVTFGQYLVLLTIGYFFGSSYQKFADYFTSFGLIIAGLGILIVLYLLFSRYARREIIKLEEGEEKVSL